MLESIAVFAGSSMGVRPEYQQAARDLGRTLASRSIRLVYGGASVGLMGLLADTVLEGGGKVIGVLPEFLATRDLPHRRLTELRVVASMHSRKATMAELADAFVALPGGLGTLEELLEVVTWNQLGLHAKPCGLLDVAGYYTHLLRFLDHAVAEQFLKAEHRGSLLSRDTAAGLLAAFEQQPRVASAKRFDPNRT